MKSIFLFLIFNFFCVIYVVSQINLIPNYSFENGSGTPGIERYDHPEQQGPCYCRYIPTPYWETKTAAAKEFDDDIDNWKNARYNNSYLKPTTPDWLDISICPWDFKIKYSEPVKYFAPFSGNRCLFLLEEEADDFKEGVRNSIPVLTTGIKYQVKIKVLFPILSNDWSDFSIYLTERHEQWKTCPKKTEILKGKRTINHLAGEWYEFSSVFILTPEHNNLSNIVILAQNGNICFDDVELFPFCPAQFKIENKTYTIKEAAYEAYSIHAGYDVGAPSTNGTVVVRDGADIIYKAESEVILEPGFETLPGAEFMAFIAPCGRNCDYLPALNFDENIEVCSSQKIPIGIPSLPQNISFEWSAEPQSALQLLTGANTTNPVFNTPSNSCGVVTYTLKIWNECNEVASRNVRIKYNSSNVQNQLQIQNLIQDNFTMSFDVMAGNCTDNILIQLYSSQDNYSAAVLSKTYHTSIDFQCCTLHWNSAGANLSPCFNYKVKISVSDICTQSTSVEQIFWVRNPQIEALSLPNVVTANNDNMNDCLEFVVSGAESFHIYVFNSSGLLIHDKTGNMQGQVCTWSPEPFQYGTGVYMWIADFWNSCGYEISTHGFFHLLNGGIKKITSEPSEKKTQQDNAEFYVFPNPAKDELNLFFETEEESEILLIDTWGREVIRIEMHNSNEIIIPLQEIAAGVYYIHVKTKTGLSTKKILIYD